MGGAESFPVVSSVVETLEAQHRAIVGTVDAIQRALSASDARALAEQLTHLKTQLSAHLELEKLPLDIVALFSKT